MQTQLESQTQTEIERSCRAVAVANSAWSMLHTSSGRDGTTQAVQVVPKVAAGNTVAVLHKCPGPSSSRSPNPSCSSSCSAQSAPLATRILSPLVHVHLLLPSGQLSSVSLLYAAVAACLIKKLSSKSPAH